MKKILVVEDEEAYVKVLHDQLSALGYEVIEAYDGKTGYEKAIKNKPDLILLDIRLPMMNGLVVLKRLREDAWGKSVFVIVLTNVYDTESISTALHEKLVRYIVKSDTSIDLVLDQIKIILR